jgi:hypothetical protein
VLVVPQSFFQRTLVSRKTFVALITIENTKIGTLLQSILFSVEFLLLQSCQILIMFELRSKTAFPIANPVVVIVKKKVIFVGSGSACVYVYPWCRVAFQLIESLAWDHHQG